MAENVESNDHDTHDNPMRSILKRRKKEEESEETPVKSVLKKPRTLSQDDKEATTPQPRSILRKKSDNANENSKVTPKVETRDAVKTSPVKIKTEKTSDSSPPKKTSEETRLSSLKADRLVAAPKATDDDDDYGN